jgi:hypothetical protein
MTTKRSTVQPAVGYLVMRHANNSHKKATFDEVAFGVWLFVMRRL